MEMEIKWLKKSSRYKLNLPMTLYNGIKEIAAYSGTSSEAVMKYFIFREVLLYKTSPEQFWTQYKATKVVNEKSRKHAHVTICNYNDYVLQGIRKKEAEDEENDERYLVTIPKIINRLLYIETREFLGGYIYRDEKREKLMIQGDERNQAYNEKTAWKHITKLISRGIHISQNSLESFIIMEFLREYDGYKEIVSVFKTIEESEAKEKEDKAKKEK